MYEGAVTNTVIGNPSKGDEQILKQSRIRPRVPFSSLLLALIMDELTRHVQDAIP